MDRNFRNRLMGMSYPDLIVCLQRCQDPYIVREILGQLQKLNNDKISSMETIPSPVHTEDVVYRPLVPVNHGEDLIDIDELIDSPPPVVDDLDRKLANIKALYRKMAGDRYNRKMGSSRTSDA